MGVYLGWLAALATIALFVAILVAAEAGRRLGLARLANDPDGLTKGTGAAEAAVLGLLGLLIALTFSGAVSRFEDRRHVVTAEANAIGTAWLRLDLLPAASQPELRDLFRDYTEVRAVVYRDASDARLTGERLARSAALQEDIWVRAVAACQAPAVTPNAALLLLPALNEMLDITTTSAMATRNHPPVAVFVMLVGVSLVGALFVGYSLAANRARRWFHATVFAAMLSLTIYLIADLEFPRVGLIQIDAADEVLHELRQSMK